MSTFTTEHVKKAAKLVRIAIKENEVKYFQKQLEAVFSCIDQLEEVDTSAIDLNALYNQEQNVNRDDRVTEGNMQAEVLSNSPVKPSMGFFVVPKVIE